MKKTIFVLMSVMFFTSLVSSTILLNQQPNEVYNLGDTIFFPITIKSTGDLFGSFNMDLLCNGHQNNFYKNGIGLLAGEEKELEASLVLVKENIGELRGNCKIKAILGEDYFITDNFRISNTIAVSLTTTDFEFNPGENVLIEGGAVKENGKDANGYIELELISDNSSSNIYLDTINNGFFTVNITIPDNMKAGKSLLKIKAYEKNFNEEITNEGIINREISVPQIPTNLEIVLETSSIEPGTDLKTKAVLHDQTGENIDSLVIITIKDAKNLVLEQLEKTTDEFLEFPIAYNNPPENWTIVAVSNKLTTEIDFEIIESEKVDVVILNRTLLITNVGNIVYNKTVLVKIGNETVSIETFLDVDKFKKYALTAPNGEYNIEVIADEERIMNEGVLLTGKVISVKETSQGIISFVKHPLVWIFILIILLFVTIIIFKKRYNKNFFAYIPFFKKKDKVPSLPLRKKSLVNSRNRAELSLSIKGNKQNISLVCLKINNLKELESKKGNAEEALQKIVNFAEEKNAAIYENNDNLFFIFAPVQTKTFKNEKNALDLSQKIQKSLIEHNKLSKQKIAFGISLNYGTIVAKQENNVLKFMSMGTLITIAKKIASSSNEEVFLSEKINDKLRSEIKTEKHEKGKISIYSIKEFKNVEENKKFINSFLKRLEKK
jgi:hypothetical protein